jgi:hypothetical protein
MRSEEYEFPSQSLVAVTVREIRRRPYLPLSVVAHAVLLALAYYFGSYQVGLREQAAEIASSLRATDMAGTARRLQDLETIKQLLEKSANRADSVRESSPAREAMPQTLEEMVERARELSAAIETLDEEIEAAELADLLGAPELPPDVAEPPAAVPAPAVANDHVEPQSGEPSVTPEMTADQVAADEVAALEATARATLARRQQRLEAKANGVLVNGGAAGSSEKDGDGDPRAPPDGRRSSTLHTEIADFLGAGPRVAQTIHPETYAGWVIDFSDRRDFEAPTLDPSDLVLGGGRMFGASGEYANRVLINSWYMIGPFPGRHGDDLFDNPVYPPEKAVLLDAVYLGKEGRVLKWRYVATQSYPLVPPDLVEDGVYYGYTEVRVDEDCDLTAWIGADDDAQIYVNDRLVWRGGKVSKMPFFNTIFAPGARHTRDYNRSEGKRVVHFNKGRNKIFFKLSNGAQGMFLSLVLTR